MKTITAVDPGKEEATVTGVYYLYTDDEARRIAALLNASDGMATEAIEALEDGGLARAVECEQQLVEAGRVLGRIANATSERGALFLGADGRDDWDAAIDWLEKHISLSPEASAKEQYHEIINGWRSTAGELRQRTNRLEAALDGLLERAHTLALRLGDAGLYGLPEDMAGGANPQAFQAARAALADDA